MRLTTYLTEIASYNKIANSTRDDQLKWLKAKWMEINKKYFKGKLKTPNMRFQKDTGIKMHRRAAYNGTYNEMTFHPKIFNAPEDKVITILKHETAHQAVVLLDKKKDMHGGNWVGYCLLLGIDPKARDDADSDKLYLSPSELEQKEKEREAERQAAEDRYNKRKEAEVKDQKKKLYYIDKDDTPVQWYVTRDNINDWKRGLAVCANDKQGKTWNVLTEPWGDRWMKIPIDLLYAVPPEEAKEFDNPEWKRGADRVREHVRGKKEFSMMKKAFRRW